MGWQLLLIGIWLSFVAYTLWLSPLSQPDTWPLVRQLVTLQWSNLNAYIPVLFCLMGVWPMIYACLMFADGRMQDFRAWPFFIGSNFAGVLVLLPYLFLRQRNQVFYGSKDKWLQILDRRSTGITLLITAIALILYALIAGDWADYVKQFQTQPFIHLMSIDFCLMCLIFPIASLFEDDMARRNMDNPRHFGWIAFIPLFGPLVYLCSRPALAETLRGDPLCTFSG